ncbi:uncharacterized protein MELLADRAFT_95360 [Melampsora larici-populina 98AG31]|uniref:Uncharacterized protein n=1 Tax=Melampsora larici-populina (strain 98AG31 / pathotype 3-4-7) TaxID=747676 RepID=F4RD56_MELLP|nr:uncharacterized protein MELLADRAFT_95360 [Melampsora larici-populina 98AG31]EGG09843.1 hypothetical protein MELLADRAFT_95360 [Melampsora larici-populina 98AG31]
MISSSDLKHCSVIFELPTARRCVDRYSLYPIRGGLRKLHLRRLFDLLHLCLLRHDYDRANRIWRVLIRCRELDFGQLWHLGLRILFSSSRQVDTDEDDRTSKLESSLKYLKACQSIDPQECSNILIEYICTLIVLRRHRHALDELELYLSLPPYSQHAGLHEYAGMLALYLAQPLASDDEMNDLQVVNIPTYMATISTSAYFGRARAYFDRAHGLDPTSPVANNYLELMTSAQASHDDDHDKD